MLCLNWWRFPVEIDGPAAKCDKTELIQVLLFEPQFTVTIWSVITLCHRKGQQQRPGNGNNAEIMPGLDLEGYLWYVPSMTARK